jgi:hypothetical protein
LTTSEPREPAGGFEYPPLEGRPTDYPADAGMPPPISSTPPPGYPGGPEYYPAYDPYRHTKPPGTNGKAIASIVCSAVGVMACCFPVWIAGLVLGVIGMRETKTTGQDGYGVALAGAIIGGLATAAGAIALLGYIALIASGWQWI